jgi:hypothetical protein
MPTARELLEQADALMRRNRGRDGNIPVLTEPVSNALGETFRGPSSRERAGSHRPPEGASDAANAGSEDLTLALDRSLQDGEPPMLTDVVEEVAVDIVPVPAGKSDDDWLGPDTVDPELHSITGASPDTVAVVAPMTLRPDDGEKGSLPEGDNNLPGEKGSLPEGDINMPGESDAPDAQAVIAEAQPESAPPETATPAATLAPAEPTAGTAANDDERWRSLGEQISMQVLQRLDLFVDTGLKAKLAAHLQPIVERAGNELVEAINHHVGKLVRAYVAEAIEREIAQWRQGQR